MLSERFKHGHQLAWLALLSRLFFVSQQETVTVRGGLNPGTQTDTRSSKTNLKLFIQETNGNDLHETGEKHKETPDMA